MDSILKGEVASVLLFGIKGALTNKVVAIIFGRRGTIGFVSEDRGFAHAENVVDGWHRTEVEGLSVYDYRVFHAKVALLLRAELAGMVFSKTYRRTK